MPNANAATASAVASSVPLAIAARACRSPAILSASSRPARVANLVAPGDQSVGGSVVRVQLERVFQKSLGDLGVRRDHRHHVRQSAQIEVIGVEVFGTLSLGAFNLRPLQARLNDADHFFGDLILQVENLLQFSVVSVGPKVRTGFGFEQLGGDAHAVPRLAN